MSNTEDTIEVHVPLLPLADPSSGSPCQICNRDGPDFDLEYAVSMVHNYVPPIHQVAAHQHVLLVSKNLPEPAWNPLLRQRGWRKLDANSYMQKLCKGSFDDKSCCGAPRDEWSVGPVRFPVSEHKYYFKVDTSWSWQRDIVNYALFEDTATGRHKQNLIIVRNVVPPIEVPPSLPLSYALHRHISLPQRDASSSIDVPSTPSVSNTMPQHAPSSVRLIKKRRRSFEPFDHDEHGR